MPNHRICDILKNIPAANKTAPKNSQDEPRLQKEMGILRRAVEIYKCDKTANSGICRTGPSISALYISALYTWTLPRVSTEVPMLS